MVVGDKSPTTNELGIEPVLFFRAWVRYVSIACIGKGGIEVIVLSFI